jgi:hypothetical protein
VVARSQQPALGEAGDGLAHDQVVELVVEYDYDRRVRAGKPPFARFPWWRWQAA